MRRLLSALMAIGVLAAIDAASAIAEPVGNFPFCISGDNYGGIGDCSFTSFAQCQATASGRAASCASNPYYSNAETQPAPARPSRRRY